MKSLSKVISESSTITGLRPYFFFNNMEFFETLTNQEEQKFITAAYKRVNDNHFIYFYYKQKEIGYLKLRPISPLV